MNEKKIYKIAKLDPSISSENVGDHIILEYCDSILQDIFGEALVVGIPTREQLSYNTRRHIATSDYAIVCGTNLLSSNMNRYRQWNIGLGDVRRILEVNLERKDYFNKPQKRDKKRNNQVILLGVGWWQYQEKPNFYTKKILRSILSDHNLHSVRDSYTETMLKSIGINNVLNTACPTMWGLNESVCSRIPQKKAENVITTLTNYNMDKSMDEQMLDILFENYKNVYIWLQAIEDLAYLKTLRGFEKTKIVAPTLEAYDSILLNLDIDYVGTRLHGGIRALNKEKRAIILAVDNRAIEIAKDTGLPVIKRENVQQELDIRINEARETNISLPQENIRRWKEQFK